MLLNIEQATEIARKEFPNGKIQAVVEYRGLFLFQIFSDQPFEEELDPFFSVNRATSEFRDFSIITDGNIAEITALFVEAKKKSQPKIIKGGE